MSLEEISKEINNLIKERESKIQELINFILENNKPKDIEEIDERIKELKKQIKENFDMLKPTK